MGAGKGKKAAVKAPETGERTLTPFSPQFFKPKLYGITLVVLALALTGALLVSRYAALDEARDLRTWQDKLNLIADSRTEAVSEWVQSNFKGLKQLADNPSLQLYFTELAGSGGTSQSHAEPAEKTYLRNLLIFSADRMGFSPQNVPASLQIPTQIPYKASTGIAVLDMENHIVVGTPYLTALDDDTTAKLAALPPGVTSLIDMHKAEGGKVQMAFVLPVFGIQADPASATPIGRIVGVRDANDALFHLLRQPGATEKTLVAMLIRRDGQRVTYLSPLPDGSAPLEKSLNAPPATDFAIAHPGGFIQARDYASHNVLITGRVVADTPWTLALKIDADEALRESRMRRIGVIWALVLVLVAVVATVIAVWHSASSRRSLFASRYFRDLAERAIAQERLLTLVSDNQLDAIYILDRDHRYRFANRQAGLLAHMPSDAMSGKPITDVLGAARAEDIVKDVAEALENGTHARIARFSHDGEERIVRMAYIPLAHIPVPGLPDPTPGVLVVEQDISEVMHEREKRLRMHRQLIDTLIMLVDKRDPLAGNHSQLVSRIAHDVAEAMGLDRESIETTRTAGSLMNIGKIVVPAEMLTRQGTLKDEELRVIRDSMKTSAALLHNISFDGPVVETLEQAQEHWDGSGPLGLKEEGILVSARIIAAVNAFVGMTSPRAYRAALPLPQAIDILMTKVDKHFDRRVVVALAHYMENQGGAELLTRLRGEAERAA